MRVNGPFFHESLLCLTAVLHAPDHLKEMPEWSRVHRFGGLCKNLQSGRKDTYCIRIWPMLNSRSKPNGWNRGRRRKRLPESQLKWALPQETPSLKQHMMKVPPLSLLTPFTFTCLSTQSFLEPMRRLPWT